ncbi:hypothetical protein DSO57_1034406 [Entomophthora muscae]|uniref:Uncharacterized protein n=1 Tax=Entomophthora muscae TaxID=34485 RepID=A0ACC2SPF3_9FUNG|nr:hypothetical protein DSO57_1034406 [Entomophthora muscae]
MHSSLPSFPDEERVPLIVLAAITILPDSQAIINSQIFYEFPAKYFLEFYSPKSLSRKKPQLCPGILDQTHKEPLQLLLANLAASHKNRCVVIHMCAVLQARVDLASNKDNMLKNENMWLAGNVAWLVGNKGLPEAVVAFTQQKMLAALGYSSSPSMEPWLQ